MFNQSININLVQWKKNIYYYNVTNLYLNLFLKGFNIQILTLRKIHI